MRIFTIFLSSLFLLFASQGSAEVFTDDFETAHDYLTEGVSGTGWDGFVGHGDGETVNALDADMNYPGGLYMESYGATWAPSWNPLGPFLYKEVEGDFIATVYIADYSGLATQTPLYHNDGGLMVRASINPDEGGSGEDWICVHYFPIWSVGIIARYANNGVRTEDTGGDGTAWNADRYLQLERDGNTFYLRTSSDGQNWTDYPDAAFTGLERTDLDGLTLQVGLMHATYNTTTGYVAYDDFYLITGSELEDIARNPSPYEGEGDVSVNVELSWTAGENIQDVNGHRVFIGTVEQDVNDATFESHPNVDLYIVSEPVCNVNQLDTNQPYFWRVDEVNEPSFWKGDVWNFTTETGKAKIPYPADGYVSAPNDIILSWTASGVAGSHDVYFGTDEAIVTNAERPADVIYGDIDNDGDVDHNDARLVAQQWLLDPPVGELPSADLNGDDDVDFVDWAILANYWMEGVYDVFKGNQPSTTFDPCALDEATEYFWRIDEVNEDQMWKGDTWSFTTAQTTGYYYWPEYSPIIAYDYFDEYGEISPPTVVRDDISDVAGTYADGWWCFRWGPNKNDLVTEDAWIPMIERFNEDFAYITDVMRWPRDARALNGYYSSIYLYGSGLGGSTEPNTATGGWQSSVGGMPIVLASYYPVYCFDPACPYGDKGFQTGAMIHEGIHCILASMPGCKKSCWFHEGGNTWLQGTMEAQRSGNFSSIGWLSAGAAIAPFMPIECYSGWLQDDSFGGPCAQGVNQGEGICTWRNLLGGTQYGECFPHALEIILGPKSVAWIWRNCHYSERVLQDMAEAPGGLGDAQMRRLIQEYRARQAFCDFGQWSYAFRQLLNNNWSVTIQEEWSPYWIDCDPWTATCYVQTTQDGSVLTPEYRTLPGWSGANQIPLTIDPGAEEVSVTFDPNDENISDNVSCQLVYRDTSGNIHYGAPISDGVCSIPVANVKNNVVVAVICNTDYIYEGETTRTAKYDYTITMGTGITGKASINTKWYDYSQSSYTITASAGDNGTISPSGAVSVSAGSNKTFTFNPDPDYEVDEVILNGLPIGALDSYTFNNVRGNHTISVTFVESE